MIEPSRMRGWRAALAVLALVASLCLAACAKNPVTGEDQLVLMSEQQELAMGANYYPQVIQLNHGLPPGDPQLQTYVNRVGQRLAGLSHRPHIPWQFSVVNSSQVNAFALPGGKISITRGLIAKMTNEDELAGVLGHEIGHVTARHAVAAYTRQVLMAGAMLGLAIALSDNEYSPVLLAAAGAAGGLMMLGYSRDQERQADELGFAYMTQAGYNPLAMVTTFQMFKTMQKTEPGEVEAWLSSHPLPRERIAAAEQRALASPLSGQPLDTTEFNRRLARQKRLAPVYAAADQANALARKKRWGQAATMYQQAIQAFPQEPMFHSRLAMCYWQMKQKGPALASAQQGARLGPNSFYPNFILGLVEQGGGDFGAALAAQQRAARLLPDHVINNYLLAYSYDRLGQRGNAAAFYRKVLRASPKSQFGQASQKRLAQLGYN